MRAYVDQQVANGGYSSASEYFRELVRQDQKQKKRTARSNAIRRSEF